MKRFIGNLISKILEKSWQKKADRLMRKAYENRQKSLKRKPK